MTYNLFPSQITIKAKTVTNNNGGQEVSYSTAYANVPALVIDNSAALGITYKQRMVKITHTIYIMQTGITINTGDVVVFGTRSMFIRGFTDPSGTGRILQLSCEEVQTTDLILEE